MIPTKDSVTVHKAGTLDDWGRPTGTTTQKFKCRVDYRTEVVSVQSEGMSTNKEVLSKAVILIKGVADVTVKDTVTWTDEFGTHEAKPLSVSPLKDFSSKVIFTKVVV